MVSWQPLLLHCEYFCMLQTERLYRAMIFLTGWNVLYAYSEKKMKTWRLLGSILLSDSLISSLKLYIEKWRMWLSRSFLRLQWDTHYFDYFKDIHILHWQNNILKSRIYYKDIHFKNRNDQHKEHEIALQTNILFLVSVFLWLKNSIVVT